MHIQLDQVSKRYRFEWIFKNISHTFQQGQSYAISGPNGSGKSTLLKILSGHLTPSKGTLAFQNQSNRIDPDDIYRLISFCAPYIELIEELTLLEAIRFHQKFKPFQQNLSSADLLDLLALPKADHKAIRHFSSGMKQRLKLLLAICAETPILLLDEPTSNLDRQGMDWYRNLIARFGDNRLIVVASNIEEDYTFCQHHLSILDFKK
ncbi:MAG: ATP-binding cassette domain-containing protein [Bacteroidetes bacterium]|nr:MAG: ATP-binding cassette domain-containing protein [Bacteroidota bacterium]